MRLGLLLILAFLAFVCFDLLLLVAALVVVRRAVAVVFWGFVGFGLLAWEFAGRLLRVNLPVPSASRMERTPTPLWVVVDGCGQPVGSETEVGEFTHLPVSLPAAGRPDFVGGPALCGP